MLHAVLLHACTLLLAASTEPRAVLQCMQLRGLTLMTADGSTRHLTPSDQHLWRAASVSVGRLGIILDVTIAIAKNRPGARSRSSVCG